MVVGQAVRTFSRRFTTTAVRRSDPWPQEGIPGSNLPFGINNRYKLAVYMSVYFATGLATPFFLIRHQLLKK